MKCKVQVWTNTNAEMWYTLESTMNVDGGSSSVWAAYETFVDTGFFTS